MPPVAMLASVTSLEEAELVAAGGADIIDCKDPARGALGALPLAEVAAIRARLPKAVISATIGDLPAEPALLVDPARAMAATGVDYVKVGIFPGGDAARAIEALGRAFSHQPNPFAAAREGRGPVRLVGVLLADREPDFLLIEAMAEAGFAAVMLDTASKDGRCLLDVMGTGALRAFVRLAQMDGLAAGLAGSLRLAHIARLKALGPDILGFRGALCQGGTRTARIKAEHVGDVLHSIRDATVVPLSDAARSLEEHLP
jgi:uncharacterized protein (UPF0264 family)